MPSELQGLIFPYFFPRNQILSYLGGILEVSWAVLGALGRVLGGLGGVLGLQESPKDSREAPGSSGEAPGAENYRILWGQPTDGRRRSTDPGTP